MTDKLVPFSAVRKEIEHFESKIDLLPCEHEGCQFAGIKKEQGCAVSYDRVTELIEALLSRISKLGEKR